MATFLKPEQVEKLRHLYDEVAKARAAVIEALDEAAANPPNQAALERATLEHSKEHFLYIQIQNIFSAHD